MGLPWPGHPLLLVLLLAAAGGLGQPRGPCPLPCCCQWCLLSCSHAALPSVPPAARHWALSVLDFTHNSISSIEKQVWRDYPWAEYLVLQDNDLRALKRHSLEGLLLLKHLDLSYNKIPPIEEHAFEPLPFLQLINLGGNLITQIQNGTFQAWHGMQFLQSCKILSHNPLSVIADASFFKLPSAKYLDLGATQVTQQTLLVLLLTTVHLETLKLPGDVACCLCQKHTTETSCRTIKFHCENLCTTSAPQCARIDPLANTQGEIMEVVQSRKLNTSTVLNLKPKESLLKKNETVTLAVVLSMTGTDGDLSSPNNHISRTNSYSSQHLPRQEDKTSKELMLMLHSIHHMGWTSETDIRKLYFLAMMLAAKLEKKLHKAESVIVKNTVSPLPAPATQKHEIQNYFGAVEQTKKTHGLEDVEDVEGAEEAPSPRQDYVWTNRKHKQGESPYLNKSNQLFYEMFGNVNPEEEPTPAESKAEQRLNTNQHVFYNMFVTNSPPAASSLLEGTAEEEGSSLGRHLLAVPRTTEPHWKQQKEGSSFLNKSGSSDSPDSTPVQGELFETKVHRHLRLLVPNEALRLFVAHVAQALRRDCRLPRLQLGCAKMVSKVGLLIKLLSKRQADQEASALVGQRLLEGNISGGVAQAGKAGRKTAGKWKPEYTSGDRLLLAISVSVIIMINLMVICLVEVCYQKPAAASQPQSTSKSHLRWFFQKLLPRGWSKSKYKVRGQGRAGRTCQVSPLPATCAAGCFSPLQNLPSPGTAQGSHRPNRSGSEPLQPLHAWHEKPIAELYDGESSGEEIFGKSELK
ncbi:unnamed protein product [Bubo scandiacus]